MLRLYILLVLLCPTLPSLARPVPVLRVPPGHIVTVRNSRLRDYVSPDGRYVVRIAPEYGEGGEEVPSFIVLTRKAASRTRHATDGWGAVTNFAWVPGQPHTLIVALNTAGDFPGGLLLWHRLGSIITLVPGAGASSDDFSLEHVSSDGRTLAYKRYGYDAAGPVDLKNAKLRTLTLPR